jgi:hypothetical protein
LPGSKQIEVDAGIPAWTRGRRRHRLR